MSVPTPQARRSWILRACAPVARRHRCRRREDARSAAKAHCCRQVKRATRLLAEEAGLDSASLGASRSTAPSQTQGGARNAGQRRNRAFRHALVRAVGLLHSRFLERLQAAREEKGGRIAEESGAAAAEAAEAAATAGSGAPAAAESAPAENRSAVAGAELGVASDAAAGRRQTRSGSKGAPEVPDAEAAVPAASCASDGRRSKRRRGGAGKGGVAAADAPHPAAPEQADASGQDAAEAANTSCGGGGRKRRKAAASPDEMPKATDFDPLKVCLPPFPAHHMLDDTGTESSFCRN